MENKKQYVYCNKRISGNVRNHTENNSDIFRIPLNYLEFVYHIQAKRIEEQNYAFEEIKKARQHKRITKTRDLVSRYKKQHNL